LDHPFIVKYIDSFIEEQDLMIIVMEYCERGDMAHIMKLKKDEQGFFSEN
jgi:serine/threonine protein kinase